PWAPMELLRRDFNRLFGDIGDLWRSPLRSTLHEPLMSRDLSWVASPAIDVVEKDKDYEVTAELPGMDEKNIEVKLANGTLCIKGGEGREGREGRKGRKGRKDGGSEDQQRMKKADSGVVLTGFQRASGREAIGVAKEVFHEAERRWSSKFQLADHPSEFLLPVTPADDGPACSSHHRPFGSDQ
ncbi:MAG: Hsp20 family protein, partial [archaeon]|nr:Hsp20 family protein [archaeon]